MNTNIYIPKRINVGYQNRQGTYTGKLAYVIYYDEKGKLRKETSWQNWRDKDIPNTEFDNEPTEGFVLNKKVGDYHYSYWEHRQAYCRVYDPRGFEFEITIENLLYILENTSSIIGKGLEGEFVYGWSGKDLVLLPTNSVDYKEIIEFTKMLNEREPIRAKDLIVGATYKKKNGSEFVYMGQFETYGYGYEFKDENGNKQIVKKYDDVPYEQRGSIRRGYKIHYRTRQDIPHGKKYVFVENGKWLTKYKSIGKDMFIECIKEECDPKYSEYYGWIEDSYEFSQIDYENIVIEDITFEELIKRINHHHDYYYDFEFLSMYNGVLEKYIAVPLSWCYETCEDSRFTVRKQIEVEVKTWGNTNKGKKWVSVSNMDKISLKELYENFKPKLYVIRLRNGKIYQRSADKYE